MIAIGYYKNPPAFDCLPAPPDRMERLGTGHPPLLADVKLLACEECRKAGFAGFAFFYYHEAGGFDAVPLHRVSSFQAVEPYGNC